MIMQENRSFDSYFGTFPGANGIPAGTCVPLDPSQPGKGCVVPFHDLHDSNAGGPHLYTSASADLDDGVTGAKNDGFIYEQTLGGNACSGNAMSGEAQARCAGNRPGVARHDAVGYHTDAEIPNYWAYAKNFVLQDNMFEGVRSWSLDAHLDMTSEWSANCGKIPVLANCQTSLGARKPSGTKPVYPWVNLFQLMDTKEVSWKYYLNTGAEPDCEDGEMTCEPQLQRGSVVSAWNPAPGFAWVQQQGKAYLTAHNPGIDQFLLDVKNGTLPQVSWIIPTADLSDHPPSGVTAGMEYVTSLVNSVMQSPYWQNTAIFVSWDDWGGFYDHVVPPNVDFNNPPTQVQGFGIRVPGLLISAYAKPGYIDHAVLSPDSYATFIEQLFMGGTHLDPVAMGQPDNRPDIRDALTSVTYPNGSTAPIGQLMNEFDFTQPPLAPLVLSTHIPTGISVSCGSANKAEPQACTRSMVTVKWQPVAADQVPGPFTYHVFRDGGASPVCVTSRSSCDDRTPGSGVHYYTAFSVDASKVASPISAATEADVP